MKILILRLSSLGDVILTQPVVQALREKYPDAVIEYITKKAFVPLVQAFDCVDRIYVWEEMKSLKSLQAWHKQNRYDVVIDLHSKFNTFIIKLFTRAKRVVTYSKQHNLRRLIVKHKTDRSISSTVDLYFTALRKLDINEKYKYPRMVIPSVENNVLAKNDKFLIGIFPGAMHKTKQYPVKKMAEFINSVPDEWNCKFVILGSKAEQHLAMELASQTKVDLLDLCGKVNISELISLIGKLDVVISNDSGPMHIAAALEKSQIAIFGATHPRLGFAPLNDRAIVISADLDCQPCSLHGGEKCPRGDFACMNGLDSSLLKKSLAGILNK